MENGTIVGDDENTCDGAVFSADIHGREGLVDAEVSRQHCGNGHYANGEGQKVEEKPVAIVEIHIYIYVIVVEPLSHGKEGGNGGEDEHLEVFFVGAEFEQSVDRPAYAMVAQVNESGHDCGGCEEDQAGDVWDVGVFDVVVEPAEKVEEVDNHHNSGGNPQRIDCAASDYRLVVAKEMSDSDGDKSDSKWHKVAVDDSWHQHHDDEDYHHSEPVDRECGNHLSRHLIAQTRHCLEVSVEPIEHFGVDQSAGVAEIDGVVHIREEPHIAEDAETL